MTKGDEVFYYENQPKCESASTEIHCKQDYINGSIAEYDCETAAWKIILRRKSENKTAFVQARLMGINSNFSCKHNILFQDLQVFHIN